MRNVLVTAALAVVLVAAGCGSDDDGAPEAPASVSASPSASASGSASASPSGTTAPAGVTVQVRLTADGPEPRGKRVQVSVGEPVTLEVTSEVADEVHVHSDPEVSIDVEPGDTVSRTFTIDRPGQVAVESHESHATVVQLVVRP